MELKKSVLLQTLAKDAGLSAWFRTQPFRGSRRLGADVGVRLLQQVGSQELRVAEFLRKNDVRVRLRRLEFRHASDSFVEGAIREISREHRYRSKALREAVIFERGTECQVCGFEFSHAYGELGDGFVEVHHLKPLSSARGTVRATTKDVAVVCSNCHRMLHAEGAKPLSVRRLRSIVAKQRRRRD